MFLLLMYTSYIKGNNYHFLDRRCEMALVETVFLIYFLCLSCLFSCGQDIFSITRSKPISYDIFKVPVSKCSSCSSYVGATSHDSVNCKCACRYESSTFGFHTSAWTCQGNTELRKQAGKYAIFILLFALIYVSVRG